MIMLTLYTTNWVVLLKIKKKFILEFFLPPLHSWSVENMSNTKTLIVFMVVAPPQQTQRLNSSWYSIQCRSGLWSNWPSTEWPGEKWSFWNWFLICSWVERYVHWKMFERKLRNSILTVKFKRNNDTLRDVSVLYNIHVLERWTKR